MIARSQLSDSLFRHSRGGRLSLCRPGQAGEHVYYQPSHKAGIGSITSKSPTASNTTFFEVLAYQLGVDVTTAMRLWQEGKV